MVPLGDDSVGRYCRKKTVAFASKVPFLARCMSKMGDLAVGQQHCDLEHVNFSELRFPLPETGDNDHLVRGWDEYTSFKRSSCCCSALPLCSRTKVGVSVPTSSRLRASSSPAPRECGRRARARGDAPSYRDAPPTRTHPPPTSGGRVALSAPPPAPLPTRSASCALALNLLAASGAASLRGHPPASCASPRGVMAAPVPHGGDVSGRRPGCPWARRPRPADDSRQCAAAPSPAALNLPPVPPPPKHLKQLPGTEILIGTNFLER